MIDISDWPVSDLLFLQIDNFIAIKKFHLKANTMDVCLHSCGTCSAYAGWGLGIHPPGSEKRFCGWFGFLGGGGGNNPSSFICLSERLMMNDGYHYSEFWKIDQNFLRKGEKMSESPRSATFSGLAWKKVSESPPPPPPINFFRPGVASIMACMQCHTPPPLCKNPAYATGYSLNKKEWICSLFKEWILEKSEIRVNLEWIWSEHLFYSLILEWPQGSLGIPEWSLWSLQNEWITQMFTPNSL